MLTLGLWNVSNFSDINKFQILLVFKKIKFIIPPFQVNVHHIFCPAFENHWTKLCFHYHYSLWLILDLFYFWRCKTTIMMTWGGVRMESGEEGGGGARLWRLAPASPTPMASPWSSSTMQTSYLTKLIWSVQKLEDTLG